MKVAAQLYSLSREYNENPGRVLEIVATQGYDGVEFYSYGLPISQLKKLLRHLNLEPCAAHVSYERLCKNINEEIEAAKELGIDTLICPMIQKEEFSENQIEYFADKLAQISQVLAEENIRFGYHNHWMEMRMIGDKFIFDLLGQNCRNFMMEFDIFWSVVADVNPVLFLESHRKQCRYIHVKDYILAPEFHRKKDASAVEQLLYKLKPECSILQVPAGYGNGKCQEILQKAEETEVEWAIVEQDFFDASPFACMVKSCRYIKAQFR